jgi:ketosteroid isomerase-like protein
MASPHSKLDEIRVAMAATNALFNAEVVGKHNFDALDRVYTADARILPPGAPMISGREGIKQFWAAAVQALDAKSCVLSSVDVMPAGDGVVEIGKADITSGSGQMDVKYVVYWREEDGAWKWHVDIWNPNA